MNTDDQAASETRLCALCWRQRPVDTVEKQEGVGHWYRCRDRTDCDSEASRRTASDQEAMKQRLAQG